MRICVRCLDPLEFDRLCDGSLPLEEMIKFDPELVKLFEDIDRTKARVWALTNAYKPVSFTRVRWHYSHFPARATGLAHTSTGEPDRWISVLQL